MSTEKIVVHVYGPRNEILHRVTIPAAMVHDFDQQVVLAAEAHPLWTVEALLRFLWVRGLDATRSAVKSTSLPDPNKTPQPRTSVLAPR